MKKLISSSLLLALLLIFPQQVFAQFPGQPCDPTAGGACSQVPNHVCQDIGNGMGPICTTQLTSGQYSVISTRPQSATENFVKRDGGPAVAFRDVLGDWTSPGITNGQPGGSRVMMGMTAMLYKSKPASTGEYFADLKRNFGLPVKSAYAQGASFDALSPILGLWQVMRNIALIGFVLIFIVIGVMIMLRTKIDPRTIISIQQALPKIIISLMMVVFSYAICAVLVDTVTVGTRLIANLLQSEGYIAKADLAVDQVTRINRLLNANIFRLWDQLYNIDELLNSFGSLGDEEFNVIAGLLKFDKFLDGGITRTVLFIAMFIALIRTFFMLLTSYLAVTLKIIVSPVEFLLFAIPGQGGGFGQWVKSMMQHLLVFPVVFFMLALAAIFSAKSTPENIMWYTKPDYKHWNSIGTSENLWRVGKEPFSDTAQYWAPPAIGNWGNTVGPMLTLAILLTIPRAGAMVKEALEIKKSASDGAASEAVQSAAQRIPILGSLTRG